MIHGFFILDGIMLLEVYCCWLIEVSIELYANLCSTESEYDFVTL